MNNEGINQSIGTEKIESLRLILEHVQGVSISYEDAEEVADNLLSFYELLASDSQLKLALGMA
jgi:hypothetical protein